MKIKSLLVAIFLASSADLRAATNDLTSLLQQGLFDEEANHDLTSAIADYQSLATQFDRDRQVAATAIYRLGECYRKLGQTNEAVSQYQLIIKNFADQPDLVTLSHQNLTGLGAGDNQFQQRLTEIVKSTSQEAKSGDTQQALQQNQISALAETIKALELAQTAAEKEGMVPTEVLLANQQSLDELKRRLAALQAGESVAPPARDTTADNTGRLASRLAMVRRVNAMTNFSDVIQIAPTVLDDEALINLIDQYNLTDLDLVRARVTVKSLLADPNDQNKANRKIDEDHAIEKEIAKKISARLAGLEKALTMELRDAVSRGVATTDGQTLDAPSSLGRIYLFGAVRVQGPIELWRNEHLTAGEAILSAGGLGDFANKKQVKLMRTTSGTNETIILDMEQILDRGDTGKDVVLKPGDHILVPSKLFNF